METKVELKETLELIKSIEILGKATKKILADGKVNFQDAPVALELIKEIEPIIEGFKEVKDISVEAKDLDEQELITLGLALFNTYKSIKNA